LNAFEDFRDPELFAHLVLMSWRSQPWMKTRRRSR
jgi:hypothetical protein